MAFAKYGIAHRAPDIAKSLLIFGSLGIFSKLLDIDLGQANMIGITVDPAYSQLIPGFFGLIVIYLFITFCVARIEAILEQEINGETSQVLEQLKKSKPLMGAMILVSPFTLFVYSMPYVLGGYAVYLLWPDSMSVLSILWDSSA